MDLRTYSASPVFDIRGSFPAIYAQAEKGLPDDTFGIFKVSELGLSRIEQQIISLLSNSSLTHNYDNLKLARIKLCLLEIGDRDYPDVTKGTVNKAHSLALTLLSPIKLHNYSINELLDFPNALLNPPLLIDYINALFLELKRSFTRGSKTDQKLLVEKIVTTERFVYEHGVHISPEIDRAISENIALLHNETCHQHLVVFAQWCGAQLQTQDVSSHSVVNQMDKVYSFFTQISQEVAASFLHNLSQRLLDLVDGSPTCQKKCELLDHIVTSLNIWRDFGIDPLLALDKNFSTIAPRIVRDAGKKIHVELMKELMKQPPEVQMKALNFLRSAYQADEQAFLEDFKTQPDLLCLYLDSMFFQVRKLIETFPASPLPTRRWAEAEQQACNKNISSILKNAIHLKKFLEETAPDLKKLLQDFVRVVLGPTTQSALIDIGLGANNPTAATIWSYLRILIE